MLAYNLGNFLRHLTLPARIQHWSLRSIQTKLIKIGAKVVFHAHRCLLRLPFGKLTALSHVEGQAGKPFTGQVQIDLVFNLSVGEIVVADAPSPKLWRVGDCHGQLTQQMICWD